MSLLDRSLLPPEASISQALQTLESADSKIVLVVDPDRHLLGTVTDGDVRRGILHGVALDEPVSQIMNRSPVTVDAGTERRSLMGIMQRGGYGQIPLIDGSGRVIGLESLKDLLEAPQRDNLVVLMAGGFGKRLKPHTENSAKPMLQIGEKPILETIIENFMGFGFHRFVVTVHYRAEDIISHFGDGSRLNVEIRYIKEQVPLGTAGALKLLPERPDSAFLVMNGDILTKVNFDQLLDYHREHGAAATMCVRDYDVQIPYGVVNVHEHRFAGIEEKPIQRYFVNAGIYALEPDVLDHIPTATRFDMTQLFDALHRDRQSVAVFPIREYWLDIGHHDNLEQARNDFAKSFEE